LQYYYQPTRRKCSKIWPYQRDFSSEKLTVRHREGAKILRVIVEYGSEPVILENTELLIKDPQEQYTGQFSALLKEYYLIF
jgi:hypothetical protein